jgi:hypothetical protein
MLRKNALTQLLLDSGGNGIGNSTPYIYPKFSGYCDIDQISQPYTWFRIGINKYRHNDQNIMSAGRFIAPKDGYYLFGGGYKIKVIPGSPPDEAYIGFSINGQTPNTDSMLVTSNGSNVIDNNTSIWITAFIELPAANSVSLKAFFGGDSALITKNDNYFWGAQIA